MQEGTSMEIEQITDKIKRLQDEAVDKYYDEKRVGNIRGMDFYDGQEQILRYLYYLIKIDEDKDNE